LDGCLERRVSSIFESPGRAAGWSSVTVTAPDGLKLHVRDQGPPHASALPVVCLPGLAGTVADFEELAQALSSDATEPRRVLSLDPRGRGQSEHDRNPANYSLPIELADVIAVITALEISPAVFVGTSRGGILAMMLASARPASIAGIVLNDIGPVIEPQGLMRIKGYVGKLPMPRTLEEGADILERIGSSQFRNLGPEDWLRAAKRTWTEKDGQLELVYDPNLANVLERVDFEGPLPSLWTEFAALARVPLMVVRGANSDILSAETVKSMRARHPDIDVIEVPDEGHAPLLADDATIKRIAAFISLCDVGQSGH
jgi:pimeloyl-ACP methyl ester carboxylesterase